MMIIYQYLSNSSLFKKLKYSLCSFPIVFLMLSCFFIQAQSLNVPSDVDWIVLPDLVNPYISPSLNTEKAEVVFKYLEKIKEIEQTEPITSSSLNWVCFEYEGQKLYLPQALLVKNVSLSPTVSVSVSLQNVDKINPLPLSYSPDDLVKIDQAWNFHASDYPKHLRLEAAEALDNMLREAETQGLHLRVFSAYRSSAKQRTLYLNVIEKQGLKQEWVAKPGHSEHQLGTTVDLSNLNPRSLGHQMFGRSEEGQWLQVNAEKFGFKQSYTQDNTRFTGYKSEPWHYRYRGIQ